MKPLILFLSLLSLPTLAQQLPDSLLTTLRIGHPRLYVTSLDDFKQLSQSAALNDFQRRCVDSVKRQADQMLTEAVCEYVIPDGKRLLATSRRVLNRSLTLSMAYRLTADRRYAERLWSDLLAASRFPDWNPTHFLDTAEMTHAFAVGYDWLYDFWSAEQRKILKQAILEKGLLRAYLAYTGRATTGTGWWKAVPHNWNQVCNGGIGLGALAIADEEPKLCEQILRSVVGYLPFAMQHYGPDGAWNEGPGYWDYATQYNVAILAGLETALGTDFGLTTIPGFSLAGRFPVYATGPLDRPFNYADAGDHTIRAPHLFWLATKFNQPELIPFQEKWSSYKALDLLWYKPVNPPSSAKTGSASARKGSGSGKLPLDAYFRASEVVSLRSDWNDPKAVFVAFKAGDNKANHSNLDLGSFVLDAQGYRWAVDLGAENYNLPQYFETGPTGKRWSYYRMRAESHNTLVINPSQTADQDPTAVAKVVDYRSTPEQAFGVMDLTPAYAGQARSVRRGIALLHRRVVVIQDEVQTEKPSDLYWFMNTPAQIRISEDGQTATLLQGNEELTARIITPNRAVFTVLPAQPLSSSPRPEGIRRNEGVSRLTIQLPTVQNERIVVELRPSGEKSRMSMKTVKPLSEWK